VIHLDVYIPIPSPFEFADADEQFVTLVNLHTGEDDERDSFSTRCDSMTLCGFDRTGGLIYHAIMGKEMHKRAYYKQTDFLLLY